jgi:hypothetical protein
MLLYFYKVFYGTSMLSYNFVKIEEIDFEVTGA